MRMGTQLLFARLRYALSLVDIDADLSIGRKARTKTFEDLQRDLEQQMNYMNVSLAPSKREAFKKPESIRELLQDFKETF